MFGHTKERDRQMQDEERTSVGKCKKGKTVAKGKIGRKNKEAKKYFWRSGRMKREDEKRKEGI